VGYPIVSNGGFVFFLRCTKVHQSIEMLFGVVSAVSEGMGVLDGVHVFQGEEEVCGLFALIALNGILSVF